MNPSLSCSNTIHSFQKDYRDLLPFSQRSISEVRSGLLCRPDKFFHTRLGKEIGSGFVHSGTVMREQKTAPPFCHKVGVHTILWNSIAWCRSLIHFTGIIALVKPFTRKGVSAYFCPRSVSEHVLSRWRRCWPVGQEVRAFSWPLWRGEGRSDHWVTVGTADRRLAWLTSGCR